MEWNFKKCDADKPYVFVSYSKRDKDRVYPLITELQEKGYNIWIDHELKTEVGRSWQLVALKAMASKNCKAVLFMVSRSSLTSAPVFSELMWSQKSEKVTRHNQNTPLKIITINADAEWTPSSQGIQDWIKYDVQNDENILETSDYSCMEAIGCIDSKYFKDNSSEQLEEKGEIASKIYSEILEPLGGNNITFANIDDTQTIMDNISVAARNIQDIYNSENTADTVTLEPDKKTETYEEDTSEDNNENNSEEISDNDKSEKTSKRPASSTGDITYTLYGKTHTENQSDMMIRIFANTLKRHQDIIPEIFDYAGMNCLSKIDYTKKENRVNGMPSYFRGCQYFNFSTGGVCIGTSYSLSDKMQKIAILLNVCGETECFSSEQVNLPSVKIKKASESGRNISKGTINYTIYGESYTSSQTDMIGKICSTVLEHHPDKLEAAADGTLAVALTDYSNTPKAERPVYFGSMNLYKINGQNVSVGGTFSKDGKLKEIAKLLSICEESDSAVTVEGENISPSASKVSFEETHFFD